MPMDDADNKRDALQDIVDIATRHGLNAADITKALARESAFGTKRTGVASRLFGYLGGIFIIAGLVVFTSMYWYAVGSAARVVITLGAGFVAYLVGLTMQSDPRYQPAATPLFLIAALLEPTGLFVMMIEYGHGGDPQLAVMFVCTVMVIQQGLTFRARPRGGLLFATLFFATAGLGTTLDWLRLDKGYIGLVVGIVLLLLTYVIGRTRHAAITPFWYFMGSAIFFTGLFNLLLDGMFSALLLLACSFMIYISTVVRSRTLLFTSTLATLGYIGYYSYRYFSHSLGWPVALIVMGFVLIGLGSLAMRLNRKYISAA